MSEVTRFKKENTEKQLSNSEIKEHLLEMLVEFAEFCDKNGLRYYLSGGTLLGAVRHKGFIPWDDDVDLMMPRKDYENLLYLWHDDRYCLSSCEKNRDYNTPFARIWDTTTKLRWTVINEKEIGVFMDIFPLDGFPTGDLQTKIHLMRIKMLRSLVNAEVRQKFLKNEKFRLIKLLLRKLFRKSGNHYAQRLNVVAKKYKFESCQYVGVKTTTVHLFREKNPKSIYSETVYLPFGTRITCTRIQYVHIAIISFLIGSVFCFIAVHFAGRDIQHSFTLHFHCHREQTLQPYNVCKNRFHRLFHIDSRACIAGSVNNIIH